MHRVHHSITPRETNSNFGFNLPWWDRWFGTYRAQPAAGHEDMTIGIEQFRDPRELRLDRMLVQPFRDLTHSTRCRGLAMPALGAVREVLPSEVRARCDRTPLPPSHDASIRPSCSDESGKCKGSCRPS